MCGAIPPLPNTPSWRGARWNEAQGQLYLLPLPLHRKLRDQLEYRGADGRITSEWFVKIRRENVDWT